MTALRSLWSIALLCSFCAPLSAVIGATPTWPAEQDRQVLEALLLNLLSDPKFNMTEVPTTGATIVLHTRTPGKTGFLRHEQIQRELDGRTLPSDTENDLRRRNTPPGAKPNSYDAVSASYTTFTFAPGILVANLNEISDRRSRSGSFEKAQPKARGWLEAYLPGYSKDGDVAVVRAGVGPSHHGAMLTAVLEKRENVWRVKWYNVARFV